MKLSHLLLILAAFILNTYFIVSIYQKNYNRQLEEEIQASLAEIRRVATESSRMVSENRTALRALQEAFDELADRQRQLADRLAEVASPSSDRDVTSGAVAAEPSESDAIANDPPIRPLPGPAKSGSYRRIVGNDGKVYYQRVD